MTRHLFVLVLYQLSLPFVEMRLPRGRNRLMQALNVMNEANVRFDKVAPLVNIVRLIKLRLQDAHERVFEIPSQTFFKITKKRLQRTRGDSRIGRFNPLFHVRSIGSLSRVGPTRYTQITIRGQGSSSR